MRAIGFANSFYTLWDVTVEPTFVEVNGQQRQSGERCTRTYFQNLSTDLVKAQAKFTELTGLTAPTPDEELRGATSSWTTTTNFQVYLEGEFKFGKYVGQPIADCIDAKYLLWYANERDCKLAKTRLCELDTNYMLDEQGDLTTTKAQRTRRIYKEIKEGRLEVTAVSNFKVNEGHPDCEGLGWVNVAIASPTEEHRQFCIDNPYGVQVELVVADLDLQKRYFKGHTFYVPKGMKSFKNTSFTIVDRKAKLK